jgi:hypothetical protein
MPMTSIARVVSFALTRDPTLHRTASVAAEDLTPGEICESILADHAFRPASERDRKQSHADKE